MYCVLMRCGTDGAPFLYIGRFCGCIRFSRTGRLVVTIIKKGS